jgi:hypothetical protein
MLWICYIPAVLLVFVLCLVTVIIQTLLIVLEKGLAAFGFGEKKMPEVFTGVY